MTERLQTSGTAKTIQTPELIVATDASVKRNLHAGAFIATDGQWGLDAAVYSPDFCRPHCIEAMELRAIWYGVRERRSSTQVTLLTDSSRAKSQLERWLQGDERMPQWYPPHKKGYSHENGRPVLQLLQEWTKTEADHIKIVHVHAHRGNLLNEAADGLATIGLNYLLERYNAAEAKRRCADLAASFLLSYTNSLS